ncbi:protein transport protein SEC23-like isoform X1 [Hibiscus syriacus]|uniref:Protein transport protein SEC23-like isoform X1 n=1 Tax=Hibiscus syriacus TaxID=106335 RepID=A0A6A2XWW4_HIBSY|nr:PSME3-interacting protein [Hibiscus syriacus]KAE8660827.1 protein transport protein SEC23-like isoform X1 [Hibiscus syriacus]
MADESSHSIKLMNFVSEQQLDEAKRSRGERIEDGTAQRDRPLYEILKENKDKKDAEFNERFKHRPPKALDEDETEFLDKLETSRREYERQVADEEAEQLQSFQAAVAAQSNIVLEVKETPPVPASQEQKATGKKHPASQPLGMIIKVKPQAKRAKTEHGEKLASAMKASGADNVKPPEGDPDRSLNVAKTGLVSYSDESEDDD